MNAGIMNRTMPFSGGKRARNVSRGPGGRRLRPGPVLVWLAIALAALVFFSCVSVGCLYAYRWMTTTPRFALEQIEVSGARRLGVAEVARLTGAELGRNLWDLSMDEVREGVAANPWVDRAAVRRVLPGQLSVAVVEKIPVWWVVADGGLFYAEGSGRLIDRVETDRFTPLPQLDVEPGAKSHVPALAGRVAGLKGHGLPLDMDQLSWARVGRDGAVRLQFGKDGIHLDIRPMGLDWDLCAARLGAVWKDLESRGEISGARRLLLAGDKIWAGKR